MKKLFTLTFVMLLVLSVFGETMATRKIPSDGTKVNLYFGQKKIPAILNNSKTAVDLLNRLPWSVNVTRYEVDFCGIIGKDDFTLYKDEVVRGWKNGDICFTADGTFFSVLFDGEERTGGNMVNIGVVSCPLEELKNLKGSYNLRIERAE